MMNSGTSRKWQLSDSDYLRVEQKVSMAAKDRKDSKLKDRVKGIHSFLDEMDERDQKESVGLGLDSRSSITSINPAKDTGNYYQGGANNQQLQAAITREQEYVSVLSQTKAQLAATQMELNTARQDCEAMKKALEDERRSARAREEDALSKLSRREEELSSEINTTLTRQQETIAKLLGDKQNLTEQVGSLLSQVKLSEQKNSRVVQELKEKFKTEMKEAQTAWIAQEKAKREKWVKEKEKEIKEMTIKGLEPEVEKMLSRQREDKIRLEAEAAEALRLEKLRLDDEYSRRVDELKQKILHENESLMSRERKSLQEHYDGLLKEAKDILSKQMSESDRQHKLEFSAAEERYKRELDLLVSRHKSVENDYQQRISKLRNETDQIESSWRKKLEDELKRVKTADQGQSKEIEIKAEKLAAERLDLEVRKIKHQLTKERDEIIHALTERLAKEKAEEVNRALEEERSRYKSKKNNTENLLDDARTELTIYKERLVEEKAKQNKLTDELLLKDKTVDRIIKENEEQRQDIVRLKTRVKVLEDEVTSSTLRLKTVEKTYQDELTLERKRTVQEKQELQDQIAYLKADRDSSMKELEDKHMVELEGLEQRVRAVVDRKDRELIEMRSQLEKKDAICSKYEELLNKQRRELLSGVQQY